jgi:hypothetical protein
MAMELQIISPKPGQKFPQIKWNNEELKAEIAEAVKDYQNVVVTVETEKDSKALRAKLNKLRTAIDDARKDMKKRVQEPFAIFEQQVKEVQAPIDAAIANLDKQLAEIKILKQEQKRKAIEERYRKGQFPEIGYSKGEFPDWLTIDQLWDDKWLNATVTMPQIVADINEQIKHINANLRTIAALPDFSFEAEEIYKKTLDFGGAIRKAKEMSEIQKRKAEAEARAKQEEEAREQAEQENKEKPAPSNPQNGVENVDPNVRMRIERIGTPPEPPKQPQISTQAEQPKIYTFRFEVSLTAAQAQAMGAWCKAQGITLKQIK